MPSAKRRKPVHANVYQKSQATRARAHRLERSRSTKTTSRPRGRDRGRRPRRTAGRCAHRRTPRDLPLLSDTTRPESPVRARRSRRPRDRRAGRNDARPARSSARRHLVRRRPPPRRSSRSRRKRPRAARRERGHRRVERGAGNGLEPCARTTSSRSPTQYRRGRPPGARGARRAAATACRTPRCRRKQAPHHRLVAEVGDDEQPAVRLRQHVAGGRRRRQTPRLADGGQPDDGALRRHAVDRVAVRGGEGREPVARRARDGAEPQIEPPGKPHPVDERDEAAVGVEREDAIERGHVALDCRRRSRAADRRTPSRAAPRGTRSTTVSDRWNAG